MRNGMSANEGDLKAEFKKMLRRIKAEVSGAGGKPITNEEIAERLGYTRGHLQRLLSDAGEITAEHLKDLRLRFPELSQNVTLEPANEKAPEGDLSKVIESNHLQAIAIERYSAMMQEMWTEVNLSRREKALQKPRKKPKDPPGFERMVKKKDGDK